MDNKKKSCAPQKMIDRNIQSLHKGGNKVKLFTSKKGGKGEMTNFKKNVFEQCHKFGLAALNKNLDEVTSRKMFVKWQDLHDTIIASRWIDEYLAFRKNPTPLLAA